MPPNNMYKFHGSMTIFTLVGIRTKFRQTDIHRPNKTADAQIHKMDS